MYARFIDGESYRIDVLDGVKYICGNFIINYIVSGGYEDRIVSDSFSVDDNELKKILKITQPLKFKQIQ
jgi:hypothetical protein